MMKQRLTRYAMLPLSIAAVAGCASSGRERASSAPLLTRSPTAEGYDEISLTGLLQGRVVDSNGCLVLRGNGEDRAVVFAPRFYLDRTRGIIRDDASGRSLKLGRLSSYGGGNASREEVGAEGPAIPASCPGSWVRFDELEDLPR
jgi:hypothetical protein